MLGCPNPKQAVEMRFENQIIRAAKALECSPDVLRYDVMQLAERLNITRERCLEQVLLASVVA